MRTCAPACGKVNLGDGKSRLADAEKYTQVRMSKPHPLLAQEFPLTGPLRPFVRQTDGGDSGVSPMEHQLTRDDWERIAEALSHFSHNTDFKSTLDKVIRIIGKP